jgi:mannose-1-phosphate guanylyltransferase
LCAGLGTRLRPLTRVRAKAAVPVDGEPLVWRVIQWLESAGIRDLVINLHHRPETIAAVVGDGSDLGVRVRYSWEQPVLGSAGGPRRALPLLTESDPARPFLLVNGDTLTDVDVERLVREHARSSALVTMALIPNPRPDKYGGVLLDEEGVVTGFTRRGMPGPSFHFIGVQATQPETFAPLADGVPMESVGTLYPGLMRARPGSVRGFVSTASFRDIGTPADLLQTSLALAAEQGRAGAPAWGDRVAVAPDACVERSVLWDDVTVGAGARIRECVLADGVTIPPGAVFQRCAIVRDTGLPPERNEFMRDGMLIAPLDT